MESKLKQIREEMGLTRTKAAEVVGVPYRTWQNWEDGSRQCPEYVERLIIFYLQHKDD